LLGCYRRGEVSDEEIFTRGVISVLCDFPEAIVRGVTNPARGLPAKLKWLPTLAEVREACEAAHAPELRAAQRERQRAEQQQGRLAAPTVTPDARQKAIAHWEQVKAEMAAAAEQGGRPSVSAIQAAIESGDEAKAKDLSQQTMAGVRLSDEALRKFSGLAA
jgi:hypothetical protein